MGTATYLTVQTERTAGSREGSVIVGLAEHFHGQSVEHIVGSAVEHAKS